MSENTSKIGNPEISLTENKLPDKLSVIENNSPDDFSSFEVAIFNPQGDWATKEFFPDHNDDVLGWQSREDINNLIKKINK